MAGVELARRRGGPDREVSRPEPRAQRAEPCGGAGSRISGFGRLARAERLARLAEQAALGAGETRDLVGGEPLSFEAADHIVENAIGVLGLPLGVALNFHINGRDRLVPMAIEEPSVVAAASGAARLVRAAGGFVADADQAIMIGQIHVLRVPDVAVAKARLEAATPRLLAAADMVHPGMARRGCGARSIEVRELATTPCGPALILHLAVDVGDAMGANVVNTMVEALAPEVAALTGGEVRMCILSNLADRRLARARAHIPWSVLATASFSGRQVAERVVEAWALAAADPYGDATPSKGV